MSKVEVMESAQGSERANRVEAISPTGAVKPPCRPADAKSPLLRHKLGADSTFDIDSYSVKGNFTRVPVAAAS